MFIGIWISEVIKRLLLYSMGSKHLSCLDICENAGKCPTSISEPFHNIGTDLYRQGIDQKTYHFETISNIFHSVRPRYM